MIRVRMAPSPTGLLHVGTARTALFNWLFAKKSNGVFILRIEDTDRERSKKEYEESIFSGLKWLGLDWDEGPVTEEDDSSKFEVSNFNYKGGYGPYRQSERGNIYKGYVKKLLDSGSAFWCYDTKEELDKEKEEQIMAKEAPRHICNVPPYGRSPEGRQSPPLKPEGVIRFKNLGGIVRFNDLVRGEIEFDVKLMGDFAIAKDEATPFYNLAAVIDDHEMEITHVIRGEDHISNTPKQLLIYNALLIAPPVYAHLPMILGSDKSKLSKRHGATALFGYKKIGYLPEAMFNFLALLGWNPKNNKEILSREEIIKQFSLEGVQHSGAVFNIDKLDWMNGGYIRNMGIEELAELCIPYLAESNFIQFQNPKSQILNPKQFRNLKFKIQNTSDEVDFAWLAKVIALEQPRVKKLSDICEAMEYFFKEKVEYDKDMLIWKNMTGDEIKEILEKVKNLLGDIGEENFTKENLEEILMPKAEEWGSVSGKVDRGRTLWPLRVALSGRKYSPGPFEIMEILGKEKSIARISDAIEKL